jgi:hypothetical protein
MSLSWGLRVWLGMEPNDLAETCLSRSQPRGPRAPSLAGSFVEL